MNSTENFAENEDSDERGDSSKEGNNVNDVSVTAVGSGECKNGSNGTEIATMAAGGKDSTISADISLPSDVLERLYQRYSIKQRRAGLECFLATSVLFDLWAIFVPQQQPRSWESLSKFRLLIILLVSRRDAYPGFGS